jgi:hypothetical protein
MTTHLASFFALSSSAASHGQSPWPEASKSVAIATQDGDFSAALSGQVTAPISQNNFNAPGLIPQSKMEFEPSAQLGTSNAYFHRSFSQTRTFSGRVTNQGVAQWLIMNSQCPCISLEGSTIGNDQVPLIASASRQDSFNSFLFGGDALAAILAISAGGIDEVSLEGEITVAYPSIHDVGSGTTGAVPQLSDTIYQGLAHFMEFQEEPTDSISNAAQVINRLESKFQSASSKYALGRQSDGTIRMLDSCNFAALDASGNIFIRPEDIGNSNESIPTASVQNTADHFRFFPSAFFRRTKYVRSIGRVARDRYAINASGVGYEQALTITQVNEAPQASQWMFIVDGQPEVLTIAHPPGSDLRRGDEIWNAVIAPAISDAQGQTTSISTLLIVNAGGIDANNTAGLLNRLRYLEYARYIRPIGDTLTFTPYVQASGQSA